MATHVKNQPKFQSLLVLSLSVLILILSKNSHISTMEFNDEKPKQEIDAAKEILGRHILKSGEMIFGSLTSPNEAKKNIIFSPLSIHSAISMLSLGVKAGSPSEQELFQFLGYNNLSETQMPVIEAHKAYAKVFANFKEVTKMSEEIGKNISDSEDRFRDRSRPPVLDFWTLAAANYATELKSDFVNSLETNYHTSIKKVNESESNKVADEINKWAKEAGFGDGIVKAPELLSDEGTLNLMSAVRVQGWWFETFYDYENDIAFYNRGEVAKKGNVLSLRDTYARYAVFSLDPNLKTSVDGDIVEKLNPLEFRMAELDLVGDLKFIMIQPIKNSSGLDELSKLESSLLTDGSANKSLLKKALNVLKKQRSTKLARIQLPKFKFESDIKLNTVLSTVGLNKIFTDAASLTEISATGQMYVKDAEHKAVIEVDKNGIKGGAFTRIKLVPLSAIRYNHPIELIVDRPFIFLIRYHGLVLFMGHLIEI